MCTISISEMMADSKRHLSQRRHFDEMDTVLRERPNINSPLIINQKTTFESNAASSWPRKDDEPESMVEPDSNQFISGAGQGAKKHRMGDNKAVDRLLESLKEKWDDDRKSGQAVWDSDKKFREEEGKKGDKLIEIIEKEMNDTTSSPWIMSSHQQNPQKNSILNNKVVVK
jgi:hypothetical protein